MNKSSSIMITFYFKDFKSSQWIEWFDSQSNVIADNLGTKVSHLDFHRTDGSGPKNGYLYTKRNILYSEGNTGLIEYLTFYCLNKGEQPFDSKLSFTVRLRSEKKPFSVLIYQIDGSLINAQKYQFLIDEIVNLMKTEISDVFGLIHRMGNKQFPVLYFLDAPCSKEIPKEKRNEAKLWRTEGYAFESIVRDIYWGNILTKKHWSNDAEKGKYLLTELKHECQGNVAWIDKDTLYFHAPFDILTYKEDQMEEYRQRLYKVMANCEIEVFAAKI